MSPPALRGTSHPALGDSAPATVPVTNTQGMGQPCPYHPDVLAAAEQLGTTRPSTLRWLQSTYDRLVESACVDFDFGVVVLTYLDRRGQSRPVDVAVGERVTRRLQRSRA